MHSHGSDFEIDLRSHHTMTFSLTNEHPMWRRPQCCEKLQQSPASLPFIHYQNSSKSAYNVKTSIASSPFQQRLKSSTSFFSSISRGFQYGRLMAIFAISSMSLSFIPYDFRSLLIFRVFSRTLRPWAADPFDPGKMTASFSLISPIRGALYATT